MRGHSDQCAALDALLNTSSRRCTGGHWNKRWHCQAWFPLRAVLPRSYAAGARQRRDPRVSPRGCKCDKEFRRFFGETRTRKLDRDS